MTLSTDERFRGLSIGAAAINGSYMDAARDTVASIERRSAVILGPTSDVSADGAPRTGSAAEGLKIAPNHRQPKREIRLSTAAQPKPLTLANMTGAEIVARLSPTQRAAMAAILFAEQSAKPKAAAPKPAPVAPPNIGRDSRAAAQARFAEAEASAPAAVQPAEANFGWARIHAELNERRATGRLTRGDCR